MKRMLTTIAAAGQQIGETIAFDRAITVAVSQIVPVPSPGEIPRPGTLSTLITRDGAQMTVNYGTRAHGQSQDHTGSQVRIAAQGPRAANVVGVSDQTDLFHTMARALGLE